MILLCGQVRADIGKSPSSAPSRCLTIWGAAELSLPFSGFQTLPCAVGARETGDGGVSQVMEGRAHAEKSGLDLTRTFIEGFSQGLQLGHRKWCLVTSGTGY